MGSLQTLVRLQAVDQEWDAKARRYQEIRAVLGDESVLQAERDEERARGERLAGARAELLEAELEVKGLRQKIVETDDALYGGRVRSPREVQNLLQGSQQVKGQIAHLEDRALELMEEIEDLEERVAASGRALAEHERNHAAERQVLAEEFRRLHGELQALRQRREALRGHLATAELALYDRLRVRKGGLALAAVRDGVCQVCHVAVPQNKIATAEDGSGVVTCDGCGRILYRA